MKKHYIPELVIYGNELFIDMNVSGVSVLGMSLPIFHFDGDNIKYFSLKDVLQFHKENNNKIYIEAFEKAIDMHKNGKIEVISQG